MRALPWLFLVVLAAVSGCARADAPDPEPDLIEEYWESASVEHDRLPGYGAAPEDRQADLAAHYSPEQLVSRLMSVFECTDRADTRPRGFDTSCDLGPAAQRAVRDAGGDPRHVSGRVLLVKRSDGGLELMTLFLANGKAIDASGGTYSSLDEFRAGNDLLDADDVILAPSDLTKTDGDNRLVTVYGRTPWDGRPWLLGGAGVVVLVVVSLLVRRRARS
ncbi:hypothetical protein LZG04_04320 [Saccharothrix sp. S26]|uniref:hypothetical protein n=1 Tax=Saccharothrix sp. S26 TaxID=2907215 RepID=UPI001F31F647|nr:hypothetical protein [Saccharothrix sp. S26]MCE6994041.1 hypothetical protein [Saccharothrix sp. S26]